MLAVNYSYLAARRAFALRRPFSAARNTERGKNFRMREEVSCVNERGTSMVRTP